MSNNQKLDLQKEEVSRFTFQNNKKYIIGLICFLISFLVGFIIDPNETKETKYLNELHKKINEFEQNESKLETELNNLENKLEEAKVFLELDDERRKSIANQIFEENQKEAEQRRMEIANKYKDVEVETEVTPTPLNVRLDESIEVMNGKIRFNIKTNLPDTSKLMVGVFGVGNNDYKGQTHAIVSNGQAQTDWFSSEGEAMSKGEYTLSISMSLPLTQSEYVQKIVGINGEYLKGDLVVDSSLDGMSYVSMEKTIRLD